MKKSLFVSVIFLMLQFSPLFGENAPKREFRGAWYPTVVNRTWKDMTTEQIKNDIIFNLDLFKSLNINAVIFQVRPQADALFVSGLEPWSRFITGTQGKAPEPFFDPTQFVLEECHKRGMEMHAWFNPYRVTSNSNEVLSKDHIYFKKPELFVHYGNQIYFDPGHPGSREHTITVISDFVKRYDIDAVHFDDYFYPYRVPYLDFPDQHTFEEFREIDGFDIFDKDNWRRNNVNILVKQLNDTIKKIKPWVKFGISPFGVWRNDYIDPNGSNSRALQTNYDDLFADVLLWTKKGWIDYNAPQLYWEIGHLRADYLSLINWWASNNYDVNLYIGQSIWSQLEIRNRNGDVVNQLHRKMRLARDNDMVHGNIWWSGLGFANQSALCDSLRQNYQRYPSLVPLYPHIDTLPPKAVTNLKFHRKGIITWDSPVEEDPMSQHHFFCIYLFDKDEEVDITDVSKIIAVTGENSYSVKRKRGGKLVVTALDKLQNESSPKVVIMR